MSRWGLFVNTREDARRRHPAPRWGDQGASWRTRWAGYAACLWALAYLPIHIVWAVTGTLWPLRIPAGMSVAGPTFALGNLGASLLMLAAALTALALVTGWGRLFPRSTVVVVALAGAVFAVLHWLLFSAQALPVFASWTTLQVPRGVDSAAYQTFAHAYATLNLFVLEPWFLSIGILLILAVLQSRRIPRGELRFPLPIGRWAIGIAVAWALLTAVAHMLWAAGIPLALGLGLPPGIQVGLPPTISALTTGSALHGIELVAGLVALLIGALVCILGRVPVAAWALRAARTIGTFLALASVVVELVTVFQFQPWGFIVYGPWLMVGAILCFLAGLGVEGDTWPVERSTDTV